MPKKAAAAGDISSTLQHVISEIRVFAKVVYDAPEELWLNC
jgi:hypothetical protein